MNPTRAAHAPTTSPPEDAAELTPSTPVAQALAGALGDARAALLSQRTAAGLGDPAAVHRMRVALRRARSILALLEIKQPRALRPLEADIRWLAARLGEARDLDVLIEHHLGAANGIMPDDPRAPLAHALLAQRQVARRRVATVLASRRYEKLEERLARAGSALQRQAHGSSAIGEIAGPLLDGLMRKVRRRGRHFRRLDPPARHRVRIAIKRLRYAAEFLGPLYPKRESADFLARLKGLQDLLGEASDAMTAEALLARTGPVAPDASVEAARAIMRQWEALRQTGVERRLVKSWRRFKKAKPFWTDDGGRVSNHKVQEPPADKDPDRRTRTLLLLRHAKARTAGELSDFDRPLAERGLAAATTAGDLLGREIGWPDRVLCSPALRTRQTWAEAARAGGSDIPVLMPEALYLASADTLLRLIAATPASVTRLLVVGHNPGLEQLAGLLAGNAGAEARQEAAGGFPTAALAEIAVEACGWDGISPETARLRRIVRPDRGD